LLDLLKRKVCAQPLQLNIMELTHVIYQMCAAIPQQYIYKHIDILMSTFLYMRHQVEVHSIKMKLNTTWFDLAVLF